jgi:hypothetical protein
MKESYTADEVRELCLHSFKVGMRVGERRARADAGLISSTTVEEIDGERLRVIQGGIR